jgi:alpha-L-arabinofuranosidase
VQKLFSVNRGTTILPVSIEEKDIYVSASWDKRSSEVILKVVNPGASTREVSINLAGAVKVGRSGKSFVLTGSDLQAENSLSEPKKVAPLERQFAISSSRIDYTLIPYSLTVLRIPCSN